MIKVTKGLSKQIISNLDQYFPQTQIINNSNILNVKEFLMKFYASSTTYEYRINEILKLCEFYGENKVLKNEYISFD